VVLATAAAIITAAVVLGLWQDRLATNLMTSAVIAVLGIVGAARASVRLRLDSRGVTMREASAKMLLPWAGADRHLRWDSVAELSVVDGSSVTATLHAGAPLPSWMRGRVWTPGEPRDRVALSVDAPGVDAAAVASTVEVLAPRIPVREGPGASQT
jgi:hypothetical protein